jgi:hypothetical protein
MIVGVFKIVVTTIAFLTMALLTYCFTKVSDNKSKDLLVFLIGVYLLCAVAIWT